MLALLLLAVVNSLSLLFLMESLYCCFHAVFNASESSSYFFLDTYCYYHLSGVKPCASSSAFLSTDPFVWIPLLSILRMVPSILQRRLPRCLSFWWCFCSRAWSRKAFSFFWGTHFLFFFNLLFLMMSASNIPWYLWFFFSPPVLILSWFDSSIPSVISLFPLFIMSMAHFSMPNFILICELYILIVCIRDSSSFSYVANC